MSDAPSLHPKKRAQRPTTTTTKPLPNATTTMHHHQNSTTTTNQLRGPGSYNPNKSSFATAPSYSMGSRFKNKDSELWQRGPGSYDFGEPKRGPSFSLGVRDSVKSNHGFSIPGPGAYNSDKSSFTKNSAPSYSIGGRSTIKDHSSQSPGPGAYNIEYPSSTKSSTISGSSYHVSNSSRGVSDATTTSTFGRSTMKSTPAFSFGGRAQSHLDSTPGPGAYNLDVGGMSKRGPSYSIASRENRFKKETKGGFSPGPGAYNVSSVGGRSAPSYTIAQKRHETSIA